MSQKIGFDKATIEQDSAILIDDDEKIGYTAIIASEIVQQYEDGYAYKSADALEQMAKNANRRIARPVKILEHPGADTNYLVLKDADSHGYVTNFRYVKNLMDQKTKRPCRRGVKGDVYWYKDVVPQNVIDDIRNKKMLDVSIGFTFDRVDESGEFEGQKYDYKQENIFLDHLAAPIPAGRCPGPICGIGYDSSAVTIDAKVIQECPVCVHMKEVGWQEAGKRLYAAYGMDVLEVIDTGKLPPKPEPVLPQTSIDEEFNSAFGKLKKNLNKKS